MHIIPSLVPLYLLPPAITEGHWCFVGSNSLVTPEYSLQFAQDYRPLWHHKSVSVYRCVVQSCV